MDPSLLVAQITGVAATQTTSWDSPGMIAFILIAIAWTLPWKGIALWKAARNAHKWWFVAFLVINTLAILEILYIFVFSKKKTLES